MFRFISGARIPGGVVWQGDALVRGCQTTARLVNPLRPVGWAIAAREVRDSFELLFIFIYFRVLCRDTMLDC